MKRLIVMIIGVIAVSFIAYGSYWLYDYFSVGTPLGVTLQPTQTDIPDDQPIRILAFGDSGDGSSGQIELANAMNQEEFDLVLHLGDLVYPRGSYDDLQDNVLDVYDQRILDVMWPVMGNHDYASQEGAPFLETFVLPVGSVTPNDAERYYSADFGRLHIVGLDTNRSLYEINDDWDNDMADWFERDLAAVGDDKVIIVFFHHVPFSVGKHSPLALIREKLLPIIDKYEVPLVLSGHDHNYQRTCPLVYSQSGEDCTTDGTTYIVSGGGSDNLYGLDDGIPDYFEKAIVASHYTRITIDPDNSFSIQAVDNTGTEIDSFVIENN